MLMVLSGANDGAAYQLLLPTFATFTTFSTTIASSISTTSTSLGGKAPTRANRVYSKSL